MKQRLLVASITAGLLLAAVTPAVAAEPEDFPEPSAGQLAASVTVYSPARSITVYNPARSVRPLETEVTDGGDKLLTLASDILFAFGLADLSPEGTKRIGELVTDLPPAAAVQVTGYTDSIGTDAANLALSQQRAQAVATAIGTVRGDLKLDVRGRGAAEPIAPNSSGGKDDPEGRRLNRRVEIRYTG